MGTSSSREDLGEPEVFKTDQEWREILTSSEFNILRKAGTEMAFTGRNWNNHYYGIYKCKGCNNPLFSSTTKFESGTGWPSFFRPITPTAVKERGDYKFGYRVEVLCAKCHGHLGHKFPDGPKPTGLRYCMNGNAMEFEREGVKVPEEGRL
ncbi:methionine-R-sulfoxide reductase [Chytridium lagenaria]|nr:methionine-R-sulfoxide reductase [Chytridium lagenaria]